MQKITISTILSIDPDIPVFLEMPLDHSILYIRIEQHYLSHKQSYPTCAKLGLFREPINTTKG